MNNNMRKIILFLIAWSLTWSAAICQPTVYYFDSLWNKTSEAKAYLRVEATPKNNGINRKLFYMPDGRLYAETFYKDTSFQEPVGLSRYFHKNGQLADSVFYTAASEKLFGYHYFENGKLQAVYRHEPGTKKETIQGFDSTGKEIREFVYEQEASFDGGSKAWIAHIVKTLNSNVPVKKKAPEGTYKVIIRFIVSKDGSVADVIAETSFGYGMEAEAIRVIKKSPKWIPAIQYNKAVNAYRRQPVTFVVTR
jgi:hypothetical protein